MASKEQQANRAEFTTALNVILLTLVYLLFTLCIIHQVHSLECICNVCETNICITTPSNSSTCFKSVVRSFLRENATYVTDTTYGCLSGDEGTLSQLQCRTGSLNYAEPTIINCCNDADYCNEKLPGLDEPPWLPEPPTPGLDRYTINIMLAIFCALGVIGFTYYLLKFIFFLLSKCNSRSTKDSRGSTCSLKADLENFHPLVTSGSVSTHSYSISDYLCHKIPDPPHDDSFIPEDLTSGLGERMLNQRTMARAVGSGPTDHVGNGRFGRVFRGQYHGEDVAVKAFRTIDQDSWKREDTIFRTLNHENIVRFIASEVTSLENSTTEIWMFLEYCPYGSLCDYLDNNEVLGPQQAIKILYSIINGLNYLHEDYAQASRLYKPSIAHRDIKSKNVLMKSLDSCCIADFGHALIKLDEEELDYGKYQHLQVGTIRYMAPEILRPNTNLNYRHFLTFAQADLYQYGLILWEVCHRTALDILHPAGSHKLPYDGVVPHNPTIQDMIKIVCEDQYRPPRYDIWDKYPAMRRLADLMVECWRPNSNARMETLGVKKKLKEMYDQVIPHRSTLYNNFRNDRSRSSDATL